jgi:hypothetical protein
VAFHPAPRRAPSAQDLDQQEPGIGDGAERREDDPASVSSPPPAAYRQIAEPLGP